MNNAAVAVLAALLLLLTPLSARSQEPIGHRLRVAIRPVEHTLTVQDTITVPARLAPSFSFLLHQGLGPIISTPGVRLFPKGAATGLLDAESYSVELPPGQHTFTINYQGAIHHPLQAFGEQARAFQITPGFIGEEGVFLSGSSAWYPDIPGEMVAFELEVELPPGWDAMSQGTRPQEANESSTGQWLIAQPQEEIYLVASPFREYSRRQDDFTAMVWLRTPDDALAEQYLAATFAYVAMYSELIGPYPYSKFALVENFWETGYGMPSFTLLGPRVVRLPFILHTSYPHEILHNWWGNSVYPDYRLGNWAEGLTAYLSDHLLGAQEGKDADYRQTTLQKYTDYVSAQKDFPLTDFQARHSSSSEAIGYGKSLMLFHMLRRQLGDDRFVAGLREFYQQYRFKTASFDDLRRSFEKVSGADLEPFFKQWITRPGAPELTIGDLKSEKQEAGFLLRLALAQSQPESTFDLEVPVAVTMAGEEQAFETVLRMDEQREEYALQLPGRPVRLDIDPLFDLFRRLHRQEIPPAISQLLGARKLVALLPSAASEEKQHALKQLATVLSQAGADEMAILHDRDVDALPPENVLVLGQENRFFGSVVQALADQAEITGAGIRLEGKEIPFTGHSLVLTGRHPLNDSLSFMAIAVDPPAALGGLSRKLPHYHKYSYLAFAGTEPENIVKGRWPVLRSPLTAFLAEKGESTKQPARGALLPRPPLINKPSL